MADESRNPQDQARLDALNAKLDSVLARLQAIDRRTGAEAPATRKVSPAQEKATVAETTRLKDEARRATDQEAAASERAARAERERLRVANERARTFGGDAEAFGRGAYGFRAQAPRVALPSGPPLGISPIGVQEGQYEVLAKMQARALAGAQRAALQDALRQMAGGGLQGAGAEAGRQFGPPPARPISLRQIGGFDRVKDATRAAEAEGLFTRRLRESGIALGLNARQMERHGALTTEFIAAVGRGETSVQELGRQLGLTIGKFAGWTAAASAVYGAVTALGRVKDGAIEAASGVELVARVLPEAEKNGDKLQSRFIELSKEFNLPVSDVTQAVYGMGKVFNSLPAALSASEQSLFAMKVGELDAATATRTLTAIVSGFHLEASQLPIVFDTINQAQNKFGGNTGQIALGVAKAAGAFRLAGGNYRELIALIQAGSRLTGSTGENVGTAIARSASRVLTPQGQDALKRAGLDPKLQYPQLLAQAFQEAQGASRERTEELARSLVPSGGQFARIFVPLLRDKGLYDRIFASIAPEQARGSAQRELSHALAQPNEQIKQVGTGLEQLGAQLARLGALDPFLGILKTLNLFIGGVNDLLGLLNKVPAPLRHLVTIGAELALARRVAQRYNVGGLLPERFGAAREGLSQPVGRQIRNETLVGLDEYKASLQQQRFAVAGQAFRARYNESVARQVGDLEAVERYQVQGAALERERVALEKEITATSAQRTGLAKQLRGQVLRDPAATRRAIEAAGVPAVATGTLPPQEAARQAGRVEARVAAMRASLSGWNRYGVAMGGAGRTLSLATGAISTVAAGAIGLGGRLRGFATGIAAALGPLDAILLGSFVLFEVINRAKDQVDRGERDLRAAADRANLAKLQELQQKPDRGAFSGAFNTLSTGAAKVERFFGVDAQSADEIRAQQRREAASEENYIKALQSRGVNLTLGTIHDRLQQALARSGNDFDAQAAAYRRALRQVKSSADANSNDQGARAAAQQSADEIRAKLAALAAARRDIDRALRDITDAKGLGTFTENVASRLELGVTSPAQAMRQYAAAIVHARRLLSSGKITPTEALEQIQKATKSIGEYADQELQRGLQGVTSAGAQGQVRTGVIDRLRDSLIGNLRGQIRLVRVRLETLQREINALEAEIISLFQDPTYTQGGQQQRAYNDERLGGLQRQRDALRRKRDGQGDLLKGLRQQFGRNSDEYKQLAFPIQQQQYQDELAQFDARTKLLQSQTSDPRAQQRIAGERLKERAAIVRRAYKRGFTGLADLWNAVADSNQAVAQGTGDAYQEFQQKQQLAAAKFGAAHPGDQGATLRYAVTQAQQAVGFLQGRGDASQMRDAQIQLYNARGALADFLYQQAQQLIQARAEYDIAGTTDPLRIANRRLREARDVFRKTPGRTPVDRLRQRTDIRTAAQQVIQTKAQEAFDTVQFEAQMGRITQDQEIRRLRLIERTMKLTRDMRRQIELRIHELQKDANGELELNVGNIRLPTLYDIRRLAAAGTNGPGVVMRQTIVNHNTIAKTADADEVGQIIHRHTRTALASALRKGGNR